MRTGKLLKLIDHQSDLIEKLREENENLIFSRDSYYKNVVDSNDYYITIDLDPVVKIKNVFNVHENGYLGYSKKEFINNVYEFESDVMFPQNDIKLILEEHHKRMVIADSLEIEHFDIALKINFICKDGSLREADYYSFYNMVNKECRTYVKFLPKSVAREKN